MNKVTKNNTGAVVKINKIKIYALFALLSSVVISLFSYSISKTNIHGDAKFHTYFAKETIKSGFLVKEQPHRIFNINDGNRVYMPIAYPLTSESLFSILYAFGGEDMLKMYSPFMATLIFILVFILLSEFGKGRALLISLIATISISERLLMTPLIEPYIVVLLLSAVILLKKFIIENDNQSFILSGIFVGCAIAVKQQGLISAISILAFIIFVAIYKYWTSKRENINIIYLLSLFVFTVIIIPLPAIKEQITRTGTFAFSPGETKLPKSMPLYEYIQPLLSSKFKVNSEASKAMEETIFYNKNKLSLTDSARGFLLAPFLFYRSINKGSISVITENIYYFIVATIVLSTLFFLKIKNKNFFWFFLIFLLSFEILTSNALKTPINQYHSFGIIIATIVVINSLFIVTRYSNFTTNIVVTFILIYFISGYVYYIKPLLTQSGREDNYHLEGYRRIGDFVTTSTPIDSIFLAPETSFRYYANRDTVWLNESIGDVVKKAIYSTDEHEILKLLSEKLFVNYIVINKEQTKRLGVNDYLPSTGLISIIDKSQTFTKVFDPYGDGEMAVYKINNSIEQ